VLDILLTSRVKVTYLRDKLRDLHTATSLYTKTSNSVTIRTAPKLLHFNCSYSLVFLSSSLLPRVLYRNSLVGRKKMRTAEALAGTSRFLVPMFRFSTARPSAADALDTLSRGMTGGDSTINKARIDPTTGMQHHGISFHVHHTTQLPAKR